MANLWYLILSLSFLLPCTTSLTVYYTNTTTSQYLSFTIPSVYATIGHLPTTSKRNNVSIFQHETCHFTSDMADYAFVYTGNLQKDMFLKCNTFDKGSGVTVSRLAQDAGAEFVVIGAAFSFEDGRAIGFTPRVHVPVVIIPQKELLFFTSNDISNISVEYEPITNAERSKIEYLKRLWYAWQAFTAILYGFMLLLVLYLLYKEILKYQLRGRKVSTGLVMRGFAVYSMLVSLLWVSVDPFGFNGMLSWNSGLLFDLQLASVVITFFLILQMWIQAVGKMNFRSKGIIKRIIYGFCIALWIAAFFFGWPQWDSDGLNETFSYIILACFCSMDICFIIIGKDMVKVLLDAPGASNKRKWLIVKITLFIAWYVGVNIGATTVYVLGILGEIFEYMFVVLFEAFALLGTFLILFFQPFRREVKPLKGSGEQTPPTSA